MKRTPLLASILVLTAAPPAVAQTRAGGSRAPADTSNASPANGSSGSAAPAEAAAPAAPVDSAASATPASEPSAAASTAADPSGAAAPVANEAVAPAPTATTTTTTTEAAATIAVPEERAVKFVAIEVGPVVGLAIATNPLGVGPDLGLEAGARFHLGPGFFAVHVRAAYERYSTSGTGTLACHRMPADGAPTDPCLNTGGASGSMYSWSLLEEAVTIGLPISYRLFDHRRIHPYAQVQPQIVLQRAQPTAFNLTNTETATRFGILGALGVQYDVGPGGVWLEAGYRWTPVNHLSTGDSTIGVVAIAVGYRFAF
jgi:hypothetical protein